MPRDEWTITDETRRDRNSSVIGNSRIPDVTVAYLHPKNGGERKRGTPLKINKVLKNGGATPLVINALRNNHRKMTASIIRGALYTKDEYSRALPNKRCM